MNDIQDGGTQGICRNCGARPAGPYCQCCGQKLLVHRTLGAWWHDFVHSVLHLDGKFWRTLPLLVWRPGELTRRYAHGERARFISPLALFLFTVFLMFAVVTVFGTGSGDWGASQTLGEEAALERNRIERLEDRRARGGSAAQIAELDRQIAARKEDLRVLETLPFQGTGTAGAETAGGRGSYRAIGFRTGWPPIDRAIDKANENPSLLLYKMQANAYKFSWALIPISVPFVWVLFLHRRRYRADFTAYDHLVFVTYSIAFMSIALVAVLLLARAGLSSAILDAAILAVPPVHIYRQLRAAYGLTRVGAAWRTLALLIFALVALILFLVLLLALGMFG